MDVCRIAPAACLHASTSPCDVAHMAARHEIVDSQIADGTCFTSLAFRNPTRRRSPANDTGDTQLAGNDDRSKRWRCGLSINHGPVVIRLINAPAEDASNASPNRRGP